MKKQTCRVILLLIIALMPMALFAQTDPGVDNLKHKWTFNNGSSLDEVGQLEGLLHGNAYVTDNALSTTREGWFEMPAEAIAVNTYPALTQSVWVISKGTNKGNYPITWFGNINGAVAVDYTTIVGTTSNSIYCGISCLKYDEPWYGLTGVVAPNLDNPQLHHFVSVIDDITIKMYVDGVLVAIETLTENNKVANISPALAYLCNNGYMEDPDWKGLICEFSLYNKALTDDEVMYLYQ